MGTENKNSKSLSDKARKRTVRMAYTLNNSQPVQCTLVSDQPFFYIDEEVCVDDDLLFGDEIESEEYSELEQNLLAIKDKIDAYENVKKDVVSILRGDLIQRELDALNEQTTISFDQIIEVIKQSRFVEETMDALYDQGLSYDIIESINGIDYNKSTKSIRVGVVSSVETAVILFAKALRTAWQDFNNAYDNPLNYFPDHAVLVHRAQTADVDVFAIRAAWELRLAGQKDIWSLVENSSLSDLGRSFGREALADFRSLNNGKANAAAFETWFLSDRVHDQDQILVQHMLDFQNEIEMDKAMSATKTYDAICQLGAQPYGKNYLMPYANMIMQDSLFTELRDRANANFLWFIKFERSFTEKEQSLQSDVDNLNGDGNSILSFAEFTLKDNKERNETDNATSTDPEIRDKPVINGSNIIPVVFGNGEAQDDQLPQQF